jgi:hypothetical protein
VLQPRDSSPSASFYLHGWTSAGLRTSGVFHDFLKPPVGFVRKHLRDPDQRLVPGFQDACADRLGDGLAGDNPVSSRSKPRTIAPVIVRLEGVTAVFVDIDTGNDGYVFRIEAIRQPSAPQNKSIQAMSNIRTLFIIENNALFGP